ncbi:hypothetical protein IMX07_07700 [bacterium]|nr:hypothetical protein [bacterium]
MATASNTIRRGLGRIIHRRAEKKIKRGKWSQILNKFLPKRTPDGCNQRHYEDRINFALSANPRHCAGGLRSIPYGMPTMRIGLSVRLSRGRTGKEGAPWRSVMKKSSGITRNLPARERKSETIA